MSPESLLIWDITDEADATACCLFLCVRSYMWSTFGSNIIESVTGSGCFLKCDSNFKKDNHTGYLDKLIPESLLIWDIKDELNATAC